jgi:hypothetical protein
VPQNNIFAPFVNTSKKQVPAQLDAAGLLKTTAGGSSSALNVTAATVVKATPGRLAKIIIIAPGSTSGAFTINDSATTAGASAANEIFTLAYNATANVAGAIFNLDWPCANGITVSAVPGGGSPVLALSFT